MDMSEQLHHFVRITHTVYPLAPSNGYGSERTVVVYAPLGYPTVDRIATIQSEGSAAEQHGRILAAALSGLSPEDVRVEREYAYRDSRRLILEHLISDTEERIRYAPTCYITQRQSEALLWYHRNEDAAQAALESARATIAAQRRETRELSSEIAVRLYGDNH
jgi:hypothetical protein